MTCESRFQGEHLTGAHDAPWRPLLIPFMAACLAIGTCGCAALTPFNGQATHARFDYDSRVPIQSVSLPNVSGYEASQEQEIWCWAACALFIRDYDGQAGRVPTTKTDAQVAAEQADLVQSVRHLTQKATGGRGEAAEGMEVLGALDPKYYEEVYKFENEAASKAIAKMFERMFSKKAREQTAGDSVPAPTAPPLGFDSSRLCRTLSSGKPLVAALHDKDRGSGHIVVVIGAEYQTIPATEVARDPELRVMTVKIWDPAKNNPNLQVQYGGEHTLPARDFAGRCDFIASADDARQYLDFVKKYSDWLLRSTGADKDR